MNIEKYSSKMNKVYPDREFVEDTLKMLKENKVRSVINKSAVIRTIGGAGLFAAVIGGVVMGGGAVGNMLDGVDDVETAVIEDVPVTEETPDTEEMNTTPVSEDRFYAGENGLLATPLASDPNYTLKTDTPDGRISLDENTTLTELMACGVTTVTDNGVIGMRYLCDAIRKTLNGEEFKFIVADSYKENKGTNYSYYEIDETGKNINPKYYEYMGNLSISNYVCGYKKLAYFTGNAKETVAGYNLDNVDFMSTNERVSVCTAYPVLMATGEDIDERKEKFYHNIGIRDTHSPEILSFIYNGECKGSFRMNNFINNIKEGATCAGVQFTDISTNNEYVERYYSIEYYDGKYSVFTMTDGVMGTYDTQYFDGYEIKDNKVVFDNGNVCYSFMLSENPEADMALYSDHKNFHPNYDRLFYDDAAVSYAYSPVDFVWLRKQLDDVDIREYLVEAKEDNAYYGTDDAYTVYEIESYSIIEQLGVITLFLEVDREKMLTDLTIENNAGSDFRIGNVSIDIPAEELNQIEGNHAFRTNLRCKISDEYFKNRDYTINTVLRTADNSGVEVPFYEINFSYAAAQID